MTKLDLNYYRNVVETQHDPEILKYEMLDLIKEVKREIRRLKKEATRDDFVLALSLLRSLFDLQNGPPLISDEKEWNEVMENIKKLLGKYNV